MLAVRRWADVVQHLSAWRGRATRTRMDDLLPLFSTPLTGCRQLCPPRLCPVPEPTVAAAGCDCHASYPRDVCAHRCRSCAAPARNEATHQEAPTIRDTRDVQ